MSTDAESYPAKRSGDAVEADVIDRFGPLRYVPDSEADWHDARTTGLLTPSDALPFGGICVAEPDLPVEIKAAQQRSSNGDHSIRGRWYVKRRAHELLLDAAGVYLLVVYVPRPGHPQHARLLVPASILDEHLRGRWYDGPDHRSEGEIAKLSWAHLIDPATVEGGL